MLVWKEIRRAKIRFGLLAGAVGLLVFLILFQQVLLGSLLQSFTGALENQSGEVLVLGKDARKNVAGSVIIPGQLEKVSAVPGVGQIAEVGEGTFTVEAGGKQVDASIFGFRPGQPGQPTRVVEGRLPAGPGEAAASREDAKNGFGIGQTVTTSAGGVPLTIVGLTERSRYSVSPTLWVTWDTFAQLRKAANPDAKVVVPSVLAVIPAPGTSTADVVSRINGADLGVEALTRADAVAKAPGVEAVNQSFSLVFLLAFVVVTLVTGFFFLILTVQKASSLVLLRAVGAPSGYLVRSLVGQILLVMAGGLVVAMALLFGSVAGASAGLPLELNPTTVAVTALAVVVLALIGSVPALVRVSRLDPFAVVTKQSLGGTS